MRTSTSFINRQEDRYRRDIEAMLDYIAQDGRPVPADLLPEIKNYLALTPGTPEALLAAIAFHARLCTLVAPSAPALIRFSWRHPLIIFFIAFAPVCLLGFVLTLPAVRATFLPEATASSTLFAQLNFVCAALLGASLHALLTANRYLFDRTFHPKYVPVYLIRFFVGGLSGTILANLFNTPSDLVAKDAVLQQLGPGIIALLGGYAAESVRAILDRIVDVMTALVRGTADAELKAKDAQTQSRLRVQEAALREAEIRQTLQTVSTLKAAGVPEPVLDKMLDQLLESLNEARRVTPPQPSAAAVPVAPAAVAPSARL